MAKNNNLTDFLTDLADGIRAKKGTTGTINPQNFRSEIASIETAKPTQTKTVTPTKSTQKATPDSGYVLSQVTVNPIPAEYITTIDGTAVAADLRSGKTAYVKGAKITGTIADYDGSFTNLTSNGNNISPQSVEAPAMLMAAANNQNSITEIYSASEMDSVLTDENVGKYYKYMGETTDTYTHGEIYCVES